MKKKMKRPAAAIMIQGTASHVGKSAIATALCRIFTRDGYRAAPFKSWNMALNSYVTYDGGEIGRAQGEQAEAAGIKATVHMNPLLIKPSGPGRSQVIVRGRVHGDVGYTAGSEKEYLAFCLQVIKESLDILRSEYEILVIEGAGSPAEINLQQQDVANMKTAHMAEAPVLLVCDADRGGALAAAVGTMMLLPPEDKAMVAGFIMNKFRGDPRQLQPGLDVVRQRTQLPVYGIVPYLHDADLAEEDGVALDFMQHTGKGEDDTHLRICVIRLPHISNFTDFDALQAESDVTLYYSCEEEEIAKADAVILPGTKNSMRDLLFLQEAGLNTAVADCAASGVPVVGICGGYQMMGCVLEDPHGSESGGGAARLTGLGLLDTHTRFHPDKRVNRTAACSRLPFAVGEEVSGYEIHVGRTTAGLSSHAAFTLNGGGCDGAFCADGHIWGTYLHGIFDSPGFRRAWLNQLRRRRGWQPLGEQAEEERGRRFDRLADAVEKALDMPAIYTMLGLAGSGKGES